MAGDPVGEVEPGRGLAGEEGGTGRGADGAGAVGVGEACAVAGEAVEIGRQVKAGAVAAEVGPAEVIDEDDDDVGFWGGGEGGAREGSEEKEDEGQAAGGSQCSKAGHEREDRQDGEGTGSWKFFGWTCSSGNGPRLGVGIGIEGRWNSIPIAIPTPTPM